MRFTFTSKKLEHLYTSEKGAKKYPINVVDAFFDVISLIDIITDDKKLLAFQGLHYEKLKGKLQDFHSLRLNKQFRLLVKLCEDQEGQFFEIHKIDDYH